MYEMKIIERTNLQLDDQVLIEHKVIGGEEKMKIHEFNIREA